MNDSNNFPDEISANEFRKKIEDGTISNDKGRLSFNLSAPINNQPEQSNFHYGKKSLIYGKKKNEKSPKYKNRKVTYDNIKFDSELERDYYIFLNKVGIRFLLKKKIVLIPGFYWNGDKVRELTWTPDFVIPEANIFIDTKAIENDTFPDKLKMLKYLIYSGRFSEYNESLQNELSEINNHGNSPEIFIINNRNKFELSRYCISRRIEGHCDWPREENLLFKRKSSKRK